jgi:hypothetical protein
MPLVKSIILSINLDTLVKLKLWKTMISCNVNISVHNDFIMNFEKVLYLVSYIYVKNKRL